MAGGTKLAYLLHDIALLAWMPAKSLALSWTLIRCLLYDACAEPLMLSHARLQRPQLQVCRLKPTSHRLGQKKPVKPCSLSLRLKLISPKSTSVPGPAQLALIARALEGEPTKVSQECGIRIHLFRTRREKVTLTASASGKAEESRRTRYLFYAQANSMLRARPL